MKIQFEVHTKSSSAIHEVKEFWMRQWSLIFKKLISQEADPRVFEEYDYHYVLRFNGQIGGIMSSSWQNINQDFNQDPYYQSLPNPSQTLNEVGMQNFHKMGMIAADTSIVPKGFKLTRVIIGCGMKFTKNELKSCEGVVSFPRPDTSVYTACVDWGAKTKQAGLVMYNAPVNFIVLRHSDLKASHPNSVIDEQVNGLWSEYINPQPLPLSA